MSKVTRLDGIRDWAVKFLGGSIPPSSTICRSIVHEAHFLWETLYRCHQNAPLQGDCERAKGSYKRLQAMLHTYEDAGMEGLDQHELWFAYTVAESFRDLLSRKVVK